MKNLTIKEIIKLKFIEFEKYVLNERNRFLKDLDEGIIYIVESGLDLAVIEKFRNNVFKFGKNKAESWHDVSIGIPNFHKIDDESKYFKIKKKVHCFNFFKWNDDSLEVFKNFEKFLNLFNFINKTENRILKSINESNTKDLANRVQIFHYPPGGGYIQEHSDPTILNKSLFIFYLSSLNKDYKTGGLYIKNSQEKYTYIDKLVNTGDILFGNPSIPHYCKTVDENKNMNWDNKEGRWLLLFNTLPIKP